MNSQKQSRAMALLKWSLGVVVLVESMEFVFSHAAARSFAHLGLPGWLRPVLGGVEIVAAILFLLPRATVAGGYALLAVFAVALAVHALHGKALDALGLVVYGACVVAVLAHRGDRTSVGAP